MLDTRTVMCVVVVSMLFHGGVREAVAGSVFGTLEVGDSSLATGATTFDFLPAGGGTGTFNVGGSSTGTFAPLAGTTGLSKDLNLLAGQPVNNPFLLANFLTFAAAPPVRLDLNFIHAGVFGSASCGAAPAPGQTCTPSFAALVSPANPLGLSPLNLMNTQTGSMASLSLAGVAVNVTPPSTAASPFAGSVTTQFGVPYQSVLATLASGGALSASYSATFAAGGSAVPGTLQVGTPSLSLSSTGIDFLPAGGGTGTFNIGGSSTGTFAPLAGTTGLSKDLNLLAGQPVNIPFLLANFLTFAANPTVHLDLNFIYAGVFGSASCFLPAASGQTCTPNIPALVSPANPLGLSPLNLMNTPTGSVASFSVNGIAEDDLSGDDSPFTALFTAQFDQSYQDILATWAAGGSVVASYSASFLVNGENGSPVPGPSTVSLVLVTVASFLAKGYVHRRSRRSIARTSRSSSRERSRQTPR
jgi:hypothetical protein